MWNLNATHVMLGGIGLLILMNNDRARLIANVVVVVIVFIAAADAFSWDLRFWR